MITKNALAKARLEAQVELHRTDQRYSTARMALKAGSWVACLYFLKESVEAIAGKSTSALIDIGLAMGANQWFAYMIAAMASGAYYIERRTKNRIIAQHGPYMKRLELGYDPGRSSSRLPSDGETSKEDRRG